MTDDRSSRPVSGEVIVVRGTREWSYERRPGVPVLGVFLLAFGSLLLLDHVAPGSVGLLVAGAGVALGAAFLYWRARGGWGLYPGILLVSLSLPNLLVGLGVVPDRDGYSTFLLGAGLLAVAALRLRDRRGIGWQAWLGTALALLGATELAGLAATGDLVWAAALIALGAYVLFRRR